MRGRSPTGVHNRLRLMKADRWEEGGRRRGVSYTDEKHTMKKYCTHPPYRTLPLPGVPPLPPCHGGRLMGGRRRRGVGEA